MKVKKNLMVYHLLLVKRKLKEKKNNKNQQKRNMKKNKKSHILKKKNHIMKKKKIIKRNIMKKQYLKKIAQEVKKMIQLRINKMLMVHRNCHIKQKRNKL